ncbi:hypothetical protein EJB05_28929, partial [Eragrostis curvula]
MSGGEQQTWSTCSWSRRRLAPTICIDDRSCLCQDGSYLLLLVESRDGIDDLREDVDDPAHCSWSIPNFHDVSAQRSLVASSDMAGGSQIGNFDPARSALLYESTEIGGFFVNYYPSCPLPFAPPLSPSCGSSVLMTSQQDWRLSVMWMREGLDTRGMEPAQKLAIKASMSRARGCLTQLICPSLISPATERNLGQASGNSMAMADAAARRPDIPMDLLPNISRHLHITTNYIRFHAVCRSWKEDAQRPVASMPKLLQAKHA